MLELWNQMGPLPEDLRLYGGTAIALYLNHRTSTDFDFATPTGDIKISNLVNIEWIDLQSIEGGDGMIDMRVPTSFGRPVSCTFMECGWLIPLPTEEPILSNNGVLVAHPRDLVITKLRTILTRTALRDYKDLVAAQQEWQNVSSEAIREYQTGDLRRISGRLIEPPLDVVLKLSEIEKESLKKLANECINIVKEQGHDEND